MKSKNGAFKKKPDPSKDVVMEEMTSNGPVDVSNGQEKSSNAPVHQNFFCNTFSHSIFKNIKDQVKIVTISRVITTVIIFFIIGTFSVPITLYYALKTDPIPEPDSVLREVNVSTVRI